MADPTSLVKELSSMETAKNTKFEPTNDAKSYLRKQWDLATQDLDTLVTQSWFERLMDLHSESSRHYHTVVHLQEMFEYLNAIVKQATAVDRRAVALAIFFHDAIYNPKSATNEEDSARLFQEFCKELGSNTGIPENKIVDWILATKKHICDDEKDYDLQLFLDLDMAVLGKESEAYLAYAALIRKEYEFVTRDSYCEKRAQVLANFLQQPIYSTDLMKDVCDARARANLSTEIEWLKQSRIPGE